MSKKQTQRNRLIALNRITAQLEIFYREDLLQLQQAIASLLPTTQPAPLEDQLCAPGEWLEERFTPSKAVNRPGSTRVLLRWIDERGRERGETIFHGTLAEYKAARL